MAKQEDRELTFEELSSHITWARSNHNLIYTVWKEGIPEVDGIKIEIRMKAKSGGKGWVYGGEVLKYRASHTGSICS